MIWDFATILTLLVAISGVIWLLDSLIFAPRRRPAADGSVHLPLVVDYARSFFPIFVIVLLLRSFLVEPFRIPSSSMVPTLVIGDFILVNKYTYGIRLPVINRKIIDIGDPQRGDVVVFRYPLDPSTPFIKRIIGLPGDKVRYVDKQVYVNGEKIDLEAAGTYVGVGSSTSQTGGRLFEENLGPDGHLLMISPRAPTIDGEYEVPEGSYFVLGDNRDNSRDSRFWGFVPDRNLVGKAFFIWLNWDGGPGFDRIGTVIR